MMVVLLSAAVVINSFLYVSTGTVSVEPRPNTEKEAKEPTRKETEYSPLIWLATGDRTARSSSVALC